MLKTSRVVLAAAALAMCLAGGKTLAQKAAGHRVLAQDRGHVVILDENGKVTWEAPCNFTCHDISMLPSGNILFHTDPVTVVEMNPQKEIVWKHVSTRKEGYTGAVEIHAFQRLPNGNTMISESGNARIIEVDKDDKIVHQIALTVDHPNSHRDTRLARQLANGHYLVCHEGDGVIREYDHDGKVVWSYKMDLDGKPETGSHQGHGINVFDAIRLKNGNTLIGGGNGNRVMEVTPEGKCIWQVGYTDLPGIQFFWVTTLEVLPNGHIVIGNTHAGEANPQLIEITKDKKVVWTLKNWEALGNDTAAAQVLDIKGKVIR